MISGDPGGPHFPGLAPFFPSGPRSPLRGFIQASCSKGLLCTREPSSPGRGSHFPFLLLGPQDPDRRRPAGPGGRGP